MNGRAINLHQQQRACEKHSNPFCKLKQLLQSL